MWITEGLTIPSPHAPTNLGVVIITPSPEDALILAWRHLQPGEAVHTPLPLQTVAAYE